MTEDQPDPQAEDLSAEIAAAIARRHAGRYNVGHTEPGDPDVAAAVARVRRARAGI